jgi:hypothetical protein
MDATLIVIDSDAELGRALALVDRGIFRIKQGISDAEQGKPFSSPAMKGPALAQTHCLQQRPDLVCSDVPSPQLLPLFAFPNAPHDDQVDALSQALAQPKHQGYVPGTDKHTENFNEMLATIAFQNFIRRGGY